MSISFFRILKWATGDFNKIRAFSIKCYYLIL